MDDPTNKRAPQRALLWLPLAVLLIVTAGLAGLRSFPPIRPKSADSQAAPRYPTKSDRSLGRIGPRAVPSVTAAEAEARLLALLSESDAKPAPLYDEVEDLAKHLSNAGLMAVIDKVEIENLDPLFVGVRCAAFAEWGRRDPRAAIAHLRRLPPPSDQEPRTGRWTHQLAWSSLLRGWAETDPDAFLAIDRQELYPPRPQSTEAPPDFRHSRQRSAIDAAITFATESAYEVLAGRDAGATWTRLHEELPRVFAADRMQQHWEAREQSGRIEGFFRGLESRDEFESYLAQFSENVWNAEHGVAEYLAAAMEHGTRDAIERTAAERVIREAALRYAQFDLDAARQWLLDHGPGGPRVREERAHRLLRDWGFREPDRARAQLDRTPDEGAREQLLAGIFQGDPQLAASALAGLSEPDGREFVLDLAARDLPQRAWSQHVYRPGRRQRLLAPDTQMERFTDALASQPLDDERRQRIERSLRAAVPPWTHLVRYLRE